MDLLIHTNSEISIMSCQGLLKEKIISLIHDQLRHILDNLYFACDGTVKFGFISHGGDLHNNVGYSTEL